jgi:hypothetical protein
MSILRELLTKYQQAQQFEIGSKNMRKSMRYPPLNAIAGLPAAKITKASNWSE